MHKHCLFNNTIVGQENSFVSLISAAALYGKGIFTTIAIRNGVPFLWEKHWRRLGTNSAKLGIDLSGYNEETTKNGLVELIAANGVGDGRARITFFDESPSPVWSSKRESKTGMLITTADLRPLSKNFNLTLSPYHVNTTSPLAGIKSCNYLENLLAVDESKTRGFDETIRLNERGEIASAGMANVFWTKEEKLYTPSLETGCLAGTIREFVLENIDCEEVEAGIEELKEADQIFLTSAGIGIVSVGEFNGRNLSQAPHPINKLWPG